MYVRIMRSRRRNYRKLYIIALISGVYGVFEYFIMRSLGYSDIIYLDMLHSFIDGLMSFLTGLSIYLSLKRSSKRFPWGLYKVENLVTLVIALFTLYVVVEFLRDLFKNIGHGEPIETSPLYTPIILGLGSIVSYTAYKIEKKIALSTKSESILSDATHAKTDAILGISSSALVYVEIMSNTPAIRYIAIIAIASYILRDIYNLLRDSISALIDASPEQRFIKKIIRDIEIYSGLAVRNIMLKKTGSFVTGVIEIKMDPEITLREAEYIVKRVRKYLYRKYPELVNIVIKPSVSFEWRNTMPPRGLEPLTARSPRTEKNSSAGRSPR